MSAYTEGPRNRTSEEVRAYVFEQSSDYNRRALLRLHTDRTIAAASRALNNRWKWLGRYDAARILIEAAPKYIRLGGATDYWDARRAEKVADLVTTMPGRHGRTP